MPKRDSRLYFQDIFDAIKNIKKYTRGYNYKDFLSDAKTADAVVRNLEIIGEAANRISSDLRVRHSGIPWEKMVSIRNKVIHEYAGVDLQILWQTISEDLPDLEKRIGKILSLKKR
ncbi:MAG: hypothetical protein HW383_504 [Candidatus Magasanikbacteria bacterium]|nr:hypothetical protein [Candidatus Magasanikbacteria bacterium]